MFNAVSRQTRDRATRKIAFFLVSLGAHVLVLGSLLGASLLSIAEMPEPPIIRLRSPGRTANTDVTAFLFAISRNAPALATRRASPQRMQRLRCLKSLA